MKTTNHSNKKYKTIGEITKELGLINKKTGSVQTHTIRYWESQFKQIKPTVRAGKRRYYSQNDFNTIKKIHFLLKEKGLTINGVKKMLSNDSLSLDGDINFRLNDNDLEKSKILKSRIKKIAKIIKELKNG